jgi:DNA-binding CsgD family transcriptional regulator
MRQEAIEKAIDACYDAVIMPETWPDALHGLARSLDAACAMFYPRNPDVASNDPRDPARPLQQVPASPEYNDLLQDYVREGWYLNHYRAERGLPLVDSGRTVVVEHDLATDEERKRLRHYNELYLKRGFPGYAMIAFQVEESPWLVPLLRGGVQGHFTRAEAERLAPLAPHFRRMVSLSAKLTRGRSAAGLDALEAMGVPAVLLDWRRSVAQSNSLLEPLLGAGVQLSNGRLMATDRASDVELQALIRRVCGPSSARAKDAPPIVALRRHGRRPLVVEALQLSGAFADKFGFASAILVFRDLDRPSISPAARLRQVFGLTPAEALLAERLLEGGDLRSVADSIGTSRETVRSQLKSIFAKTDTHRQSELVALIARLAPGTANGSGWG